MYVGITRAAQPRSELDAQTQKGARDDRSAASRFIAEMALDKATTREDPREAQGPACRVREEIAGCGERQGAGKNPVTDSRNIINRLAIAILFIANYAHSTWANAQNHSQTPANTACVAAADIGHHCTCMGCGAPSSPG